MIEICFLLFLVYTNFEIVQGCRVWKGDLSSIVKRKKIIFIQLIILMRGANIYLHRNSYYLM